MAATDGGRDLFDTVVIAIDDSPVSLLAIEEIIPNAQAAGGSVVVVFVRQRPMTFDADGTDTSSTWALVEESLQEREHNAEHDVIARLKDRGIPAVFAVREGDPAREIIATAEEHGATLVVLGATLHGALGSILLSSVSEYLVHHCPVPLLLIRPPKDEGTT